MQCLNQTFIDLGKLVHDQGAFVDSIEAHLQMTESRVESGSEALRVAHQRKVRPLQIFFNIFRQLATQTTISFS